MKGTGSGLTIHQWTAGAVTGDAITSYVMALQSIIRKWGYNSEFFADYRHVSFDARRHCRDIRSFPKEPGAGNTVIYHFSIGSDLTERFLSLPAGVSRVLYYHNITPARYFRSFRPRTAKVLEEGRRQLRLLAPRVDLALGASNYNCAELREAGCARTAVVPLLWQVHDVTQPPDRGVSSSYGDRAVNWIFVGRVAPNKKLEDLIKTFYFARKFIHPHSRLFLIGSFNGMERYVSSLRALAVQLDLPNVIFTGHVTASQLVAYYQLADVFVCMSEHEGFCLPLIEAMSFGVPVVAFAAAAVPETVGGGGIVFNRKDYREVAELVHLAATDAAVRERLVAAGKERLRAFDVTAVEEALRTALRPAKPLRG